MVNRSLGAQDFNMHTYEQKTGSNIYAKDFRVFSISPEMETLDFQLPAELEAGEPPEARGLARDQVRLMVSYRSTGRIVHTGFRSLPDFLKAGDVLVINTSGTLNAALKARRADGTALELHLSTHLPADLWVIELRRISNNGTLPFYQAKPGERIDLTNGGWAILHTAYRPEQRDQQVDGPDRIRLWIATLHLPQTLEVYLENYGFPIRYKYVRDSWPISYYQTVYATETGSAEMPSAGRAFTPELITRLMAKGVQIAPLILHTGVASLEDHEPPYEEYYRVPTETVGLINAAHHSGKQVVAVGTTVVRALESVTNENGVSHPGEGWTDVIVTPERGIHSVDGMLTGLHEPRSTHLAMLAALAGQKHLRLAYAQALQHGYLWHEFGDLHLILP